MGEHQWRGLWTWEVLLWKAGSRNKAAGWNTKVCLVKVGLWLLHLPIDFKRDLGATVRLCGKQLSPSWWGLKEAASGFGPSEMTCIGPPLHPNPLESSHPKQRCGFQGAVGRSLQGAPFMEGVYCWKNETRSDASDTLWTASRAPSGRCKSILHHWHWNMGRKQVEKYLR